MIAIRLSSFCGLTATVSADRSPHAIVGGAGAGKTRFAQPLVTDRTQNSKRLSETLARAPHTFALADEFTLELETDELHYRVTVRVQEDEARIVHESFNGQSVEPLSRETAFSEREQLMAFLRAIRVYRFSDLSHLSLARRRFVEVGDSQSLRPDGENLTDVARRLDLSLPFLSRASDYLRREAPFGRLFLVSGAQPKFVGLRYSLGDEGRVLPLATLSDQQLLALLVFTASQMSASVAMFDVRGVERHRRLLSGLSTAVFYSADSPPTVFNPSFTKL